MSTPRASGRRRRRAVSSGWLASWVLLVLATSVVGQWVVFAPREALRLLEHGTPHPVATRDVPFADQINRAAVRHGLDPALVAAVVAIESDFDPRAVSPKGARGLMQVMPHTWPEVAPVACPALACAFQPEANLEAGSRYLSRMLSRFGGDVTLALAAYNAGPGAVARHGGVPPYPETAEYLRRVSLAWLELRRAGGSLHPLMLSGIRSFVVWETAFHGGLLTSAVVTLAIAWRAVRP